jgi:hypothetical protein
MSENGLELNGGKLQDFTIDQLAGALALSLGAVGTLLLVIWQSRCSCRCRLGLSDKCYIFDCAREPPPLEEDDKKKKKIDPKKPVAAANTAERRRESFELSEQEVQSGTFPETEPEPEPEPEIIPKSAP